MKKTGKVSGYARPHGDTKINFHLITIYHYTTAIQYRTCNLSELSVIEGAAATECRPPL